MWADYSNKRGRLQSGGRETGKKFGVRIVGVSYQLSAVGRRLEENELGADAQGTGQVNQIHS